MRQKTRGAKLVVALLVLLGAGAAFDGVQLARIHALNHAIADGSVVSLAGDLPAQAMFARAYYRDRRGDHQAALNLYMQVESEGDAALREAARYNSANIYLRQAFLARESGTVQQMLSLAELAKGTYREVLRGDSRDWDAKYNLERALRLVPDPEDVAAIEPPPRSERAVTTMKGLSLGLP